MKVFVALALSFLSVGALAFTSLGEVLSIQKMQDGTYQAVCKGLTYETLTDLDLRLGNMCPKVTDSSSLGVLSLQNRGDGLYNVICLDSTFRAGVTREQVMSGEACR